MAIRPSTNSDSFPNQGSPSFLHVSFSAFRRLPSSLRRRSAKLSWCAMRLPLQPRPTRSIRSPQVARLDASILLLLEPNREITRSAPIIISPNETGVPNPLDPQEAGVVLDIEPADIRSPDIMRARRLTLGDNRPLRSGNPLRPRGGGWLHSLSRIEPPRPGLAFYANGETCIRGAAARP